MALGTLKLNPFSKSRDNRIVSENKVLNNLRIIIPNEGPFHHGTVEMAMLNANVLTPLKYGVDYENAFLWSDATSKLGSKVYAAILLSANIPLTNTTLFMSYNAVGGSLLTGLDFSSLAFKTPVEAKYKTVETFLVIPSFPSIIDIWNDADLVNIATAKATLQQLGLQMVVTNRSI